VDIRELDWSGVVGMLLLPLTLRNPVLLANPTASSLGARLGRLSFGYFDQPFGLLKGASLPFKEK
jgi:hypothetical protein